MAYHGMIFPTAKDISDAMKEKGFQVRSLVFLQPTLKKTLNTIDYEKNKMVDTR